jgi:hypothetical protein
MMPDANSYPMSDLTGGDFVGKVTTVGFTHGGLGNQWTVIDGKRYVTYWDIRTTDWRVGDMVRFTVQMIGFGYSNYGEPPKAPHVVSIHRVEKDHNGNWFLSPRVRS